MTPRSNSCTVCGFCRDATISSERTKSGKEREREAKSEKRRANLFEDFDFLLQFLKVAFVVDFLDRQNAAGPLLRALVHRSIGPVPFASIK